VDKQFCKDKKEKEKAEETKKKWSKSALIVAVSGTAIAIATFFCCFILVPLGFISAAIFLRRYGTLVMIGGASITGLAIFLILREKRGRFSFCAIVDYVKKFKKFIIAGVIILIGVTLAIISLRGNFSEPKLAGRSNHKIASKWKGDKADSDLVRVVNFLEGNKGKEIKLSGEKHIINGKEELGIRIIMLECCTKEEFDDIIKQISVNGKVKNSDFDKKEIWANVAVNEIPKLADIWNVKRIDFAPEARTLWLSITK